MPYPNEHSARINSPSKYDSFARKNDVGGAGIDFIFGIKEGKSEIQAIRFDASKFSPAEARAWLKAHGHKPIEFAAATKAQKDIVTIEGNPNALPPPIIWPGTGGGKGKVRLIDVAGGPRKKRLYEVKAEKGMPLASALPALAVKDPAGLCQRAVAGLPTVILTEEPPAEGEMHFLVGDDGSEIYGIAVPGAAVGPFSSAEQIPNPLPFAHPAVMWGAPQALGDQVATMKPGGEYYCVPVEILEAYDPPIEVEISVAKDAAGISDTVSENSGSQDGQLGVRKETWFPIIRTDGPRQLATAIVLEPETIDAQRQIYDAPLIEAAAHDWLANFGERRTRPPGLEPTKIGAFHEILSVPDVVPVESWIAPCDLTIGRTFVKKGSWIVTFWVRNVEYWRRIETGEITGVSIDGDARALFAA
jgi:hypothetical protein